MIDDTFIEILRKFGNFVNELKKDYDITNYRFKLINEKDIITLNREKK